LKIQTAAAGGEPAPGTRASGSASAPPPGRPEARIAAETQRARADFHRAAAGSASGSWAAPNRRSAALQAFFVANAGRTLLPSAETSGVLSPNLKTEET